MNSPPIKVLLIEDNPGDARLIKEALLDTRKNSFELKCVERLSAGLELLSKGDTDVVLLDLSLPDSAGLDTFSHLHARMPSVPVVVLTGMDDDALALEALRNGAQDYLVKKDIDGRVLSRIMRYAIERKKLQQLKDEFVGAISHEMRTPMTIMREGVSQILEGLRGDITEDQKRILEISLKAIDRLRRIIDDLLEISKIEAGKSHLSREFFDMVALAREIKAAFQSQAQLKGLEIRENFSKSQAVICADKDKIIQVLTNLMGNAIKFTKRGHIEIQIEDRADAVAVSVSDTGKGIAEANLPKVFSKFQQFDRTAGPGEKGTGLGLSICKGIVELHHGQIRVESHINRGSKFIFVLPKQTPRKLFEEYVANGIKEADRQKTSLSVLVFEIQNFELILEKMGNEKATDVFQYLESAIKKNLRRHVDQAALGVNPNLTVLQETPKEDALAIARKIQKIFEDYLTQEGLNEQVRIISKIASFPEDGKTSEEILSRVFSYHKNK